ncbi:hypothetical protein DCAR_0933718 [Daucus carota subsp. sativus]|uniref:C2H2-type domain-containing protein n=2 Tax=Daucus carota subsp. sativus TaxID=79200 RepID=A0AAF0XTR5_DAUCS|nr:hypothetical protein DCAR_0933718 [Daucus carota subsp. sativus]
MGFFGFYVVLKCFKHLAWPTFALVYPLCASVQAIETNSNCEMRKLVTYWVLFSLISLLDHTFGGLIDWLPVWPYAKIIAIFWLVIPRFDGAGIAYNCFVRPCLSGQLPQVVLVLLNKNQDPSLEEESFPVPAQRDIIEHGGEALEELISTKPKVMKPTSSNADIKTVKILTGTASAIDKASSTMKPNTRVDVKVLTLPAPLVQNVQREWTCAVCQVTTTSEATLNSHLQGRKHKIKCEELKAGKQTTMRVVTIGGTNRVRYCTICQVKTQSEAIWNSHVQGKKHKSKCKELRAIVKAEKNNFSSTATKSCQANQDPNNRFGCDICQMTLQSEVTLQSHLQGKRHKSNSEQFKARKMAEEYAFPAS